MSNFQVLKLSNGDDVICNLVETKDNTFKITSPLKMDTVNRITKKGVSESVGLTRYYQYVLRTLDKMVVKEKFNPTEISEEEYLEALELKKALDKEKKKPLIDEDVPEDDILEEEEKLLLDLMDSKKTIH